MSKAPLDPSINPCQAVFACDFLLCAIARQAAALDSVRLLDTLTALNRACQLAPSSLTHFWRVFVEKHWPEENETAKNADVVRIARRFLANNRPIERYSVATSDGLMYVRRPPVKGNATDLDVYLAVRVVRRVVIFAKNDDDGVYPDTSAALAFGMLESMLAPTTRHSPVQIDAPQRLEAYKRNCVAFCLAALARTEPGRQPDDFRADLTFDDVMTPDFIDTHVAPNDREPTYNYARQKLCNFVVQALAIRPHPIICLCCSSTNVVVLEFVHMVLSHNDEDLLVVQCKDCSLYQKRYEISGC